MIRARFYLRFKDCGNDYRPVQWPIKYPYWCTGESSDAFILVAYADNVEQIMELVCGGFYYLTERNDKEWEYTVEQEYID